MWCGNMLTEMLDLNRVLSFAHPNMSAQSVLSKDVIFLCEN